MALIGDLLLQAVQMVLVVAVAPAVLGVTRKVKARLLRRIGPPTLQPYRDLWKLMHKEAVFAHNASWVYRSAPYIIFAATWVAAPTTLRWRSAWIQVVTRARVTANPANACGHPAPHRQSSWWGASPRGQSLAGWSLTHTLGRRGGEHDVDPVVGGVVGVGGECWRAAVEVDAVAAADR